MRNFIAFVLALVLVFSGATVLSHVPQKVTKPEDVEIGTVANLTSSESHDSNAVEVDGIRFETLLPERVLTIPANQPHAYIPVRFGVRLTNNTPTAIRFSQSSFTPEFLGLNGENLLAGELQISFLFLQKSDFPLVMPGESLTLFWEGKFSWIDNNIYLQFSNERYRRLWHFKGFKLGTSQVRFTYSNALAERLYRDLEKHESRRLEGVLTGYFSTPLVEFSLVQP